MQESRDTISLLNNSTASAVTWINSAIEQARTPPNDVVLRHRRLRNRRSSAIVGAKDCHRSRVACVEKGPRCQ